MDKKHTGDDKAAPKHDHDSCHAELQEITAERDDFKTKYLRALADYQNFERRVRDEREEIGKATQAMTILKLVGFLDNLDQAEMFIKDPGLKMIKDQFGQTLKSMGLEEIDMLDKEFDPHVAEAIDTVEGEKDDIVVEVLKKGYRFHGKVLRPAQVKVSRKK